MNMAQSILSQAQNLSKTFPTPAQGKGAVLHAVTQVDLAIFRGETLALVGESGCGKSTLGRLLLGLLPPSEGQAFFDGQDLAALPPRDLRHLRRRMQPVFQDTAASLNPRLDVAGILAEPLRIHNLCPPAARREEAARLLEQVGLSGELLDRYPHELSGGQRQRVVLARALASQPEFLVCDEPVSALDVSIQAQIVNLMSRIQQELQVAYLFIGHDLSVVRHISHKVAVLYLGKIMEYTSSDELYAHPLHPYTQALVSAVPVPDPVVDRARERIILEGEIPSPLNPPKGCNFCTRCKYADERCRTEEPALTCVGADHYVACHKVAER
jgi:oligopeptide/dipeptide ABC transporter ATP-binding protein